MLSNKHQLLQAYLLNGVLFSEESIPEKVSSFYLFHFNEDIQNAVKNVVDSSLSLSVCEKITIHGVKYSVEQIICIETYSENNNCLFGKIMLILGKRTYFIVKCMIGEWDYDHALHELRDENLPVICLDIKDLKKFYPLSCYSCCNLNIITLKHKLC